MKARDPELAARIDSEAEIAALEVVTQLEYRVSRRALLRQRAGDVMTARFAGYTDAGLRFVIAADWENDTHKQLSKELCRRALIEHACTIYSVSSEAWISSYELGEDTSTHGMPSERANRIEALIVYVESRRARLSTAWRIERDRHGRIAALLHREPRAEPIGGELAGLLFQARHLH